MNLRVVIVWLVDRLDVGYEGKRVLEERLELLVGRD